VLILLFSRRRAPEAVIQDPLLVPAE
jgi:hypothetical protein